MAAESAELTGGPEGLHAPLWGAGASSAVLNPAQPKCRHDQTAFLFFGVLLVEGRPPPFPRPKRACLFPFSASSAKGFPEALFIHSQEPFMSDGELFHETIFMPKNQHQDQQPGRQAPMNPPPQTAPRNVGSNRLKGKVAIVTGADSGIGRAVAQAFAQEGAKVVVAYLNEKEDAEETLRLIRQISGEAQAFAGDIGDEAVAQSLVASTLSAFGKIDILVNNAGEQHPQKSLADVSCTQLEKTFRTNVFGMFHLTQAVLPHLKPGARIINTASVTAYEGNPLLLDYSATKGAIVSFTRALAQHLADKGILVNAVAPGPIWTPLIPSTFTDEQVDKFGKSTPLGRPGQPNEVAPSYVFLATQDSSYMSGQVLHPNGGSPVGG